MATHTATPSTSTASVADSPVCSTSDSRYGCAMATSSAYPSER